MRYKTVTYRRIYKKQNGDIHEIEATAKVEKGDEIETCIRGVIRKVNSALYASGSTSIKSNQIY